MKNELDDIDHITTGNSNDVLFIAG